MNTLDAKQKPLENASSIKSLGHFLFYFGPFIGLFLLLILWQYLSAVHSSYADLAMDIFIAVAIFRGVDEKLIKSAYFFIPIILCLGVLIVAKQYELPTEKWIMIFGVLLGAKIDSMIKAYKRTKKLNG